MSSENSEGESNKPDSNLTTNADEKASGENKQIFPLKSKTQVSRDRLS